MPSVALIVVNYKSASLAIDAIRTARSATTNPLQVVVVDNSVDDAEAGQLRSHADVLIVADRNLGYAAAINRARNSITADALIVSNPDVRFDRGAIDTLLAAGAAVAGPALFWDDAYEWLLPPSELHTTREVIDRTLASRFEMWNRARDRRRIRERLRFWSLDRTAHVKALSGAVLAIRTAAFDAAGGFDERFRLYFEENDFLRRLEGDIVYVPSARCRHIYNQSAAGTSEAAALFDASRRAYLQKWTGTTATRIIENIERPLVAHSAMPLHSDTLEVPADALVEASPLPSFDTAAGHLPRTATVRIPPEVWSAYRSKSLHIRVIDRGTAAVLATYTRSKMSA